MRDNAATWLQAFVWAQTGAAILVTAWCLLALGIAAYVLHRLTRWALGRARHRTDLARMRRRPAPPRTASEQAVLDYLTIRTAWNQPTREEIGR
ncbi:hypothetical protein ABZW44_22710 [Streptomyces mirabilis]|uniref:hypothetical protein n=1 Tax=Streptomyces mirabilis TaxID=68239 RepID=UPI0033AB0E8A